MEELSFEQALDKLEMIVNKLEKDQLSLDESLKIFEEGIGLYRLCNGKLSQAEKKINMIIEENGGLKEIPFKYGDE